MKRVIYLPLEQFKQEPMPRIQPPPPPPPQPPPRTPPPVSKPTYRRFFKKEEEEYLWGLEALTITKTGENKLKKVMSPEDLQKELSKADFLEFWRNAKKIYLLVGKTIKDVTSTVKNNYDKINAFTTELKGIRNKMYSGMTEPERLTYIDRIEKMIALTNIMLDRLDMLALGGYVPAHLQVKTHLEYFPKNTISLSRFDKIKEDMIKALNEFKNTASVMKEILTLPNLKEKEEKPAPPTPPPAPTPEAKPEEKKEEEKIKETILPPVKKFPWQGIAIGGASLLLLIGGIFLLRRKWQK
jgi:hypothetical protein